MIQKSQGTKDDFLLRKLFEEFDRNQNYSIGSYELDLMLKQLDVKASPKLIDPLLSKIDLNKSGFIEYDEFKKYLFTDPYPIWSLIISKLLTIYNVNKNYLINNTIISKHKMNYCYSFSQSNKPQQPQSQRL